MLTEPKIVTKPAQPYAAIVLEVSQPEISQKAPPLIGDVIAWAKNQGVALAGPPFFNYVSFKPGGRMEMQVGMPTATVAKADSTMTTGALPAGRYASVTLTGPYHELYQANMTLQKWLEDQGHEVAVDSDGRQTRLEIYQKDPGEDPSGHPVTEVAFRVGD